jgi:hypothetical protein
MKQARGRYRVQTTTAAAYGCRLKAETTAERVAAARFSGSKPPYQIPAWQGEPDAMAGDPFFG